MVYPKLGEYSASVPLTQNIPHQFPQIAHPYYLIPSLYLLFMYKRWTSSLENGPNTSFPKTVGYPKRSVSVDVTHLSMSHF